METISICKLGRNSETDFTTLTKNQFSSPFNGQEANIITIISSLITLLTRTYYVHTCIQIYNTPYGRNLHHGTDDRKLQIRQTQNVWQPSQSAAALCVNYANCAIASEREREKFLFVSYVIVTYVRTRKGCVDVCLYVRGDKGTHVRT